jgi:hypothetical protein
MNVLRSASFVADTIEDEVQIVQSEVVDRHQMRGDLENALSNAK